MLDFVKFERQRSPSLSPQCPFLSLLQELLVVPTGAHYSPISGRGHETAAEGVQVSMNFLVVILLSRYILSLSEEICPAFHQAVVTLALLTSARSYASPYTACWPSLSSHWDLQSDLCLSSCLALGCL